MERGSKQSPLYGFRFSREHRRTIQTRNREVISGAFARCSLQPGRVEVPLGDLSVNGKQTDKVALVVYFEPSSTLRTFVELEESVISRREVCVVRGSMIDWAEQTVPFWLFGNSILTVRERFEGNGLGSALLIGSEKLCLGWARTLGEPTRVIAHHFDGAHGAEESADCRRGYRTGWTGNILSKLGYTNKREALEYYLGEAKVAQMGNPERNWLKIFRE